MNDEVNYELHKVYHFLDIVQSREDLVVFIRALRDNLLEEPENWENPNLEMYLESMAAWVEDMPKAFAYRGEEMPEDVNWKLIAKILNAASAYE